MSDLTDGGAALAQALFGGQRLEDNARLKREMLYDQQDSGRATLDRKISEAIQKRDLLRAQQGLPGTYGTVFGVKDPAQARGFADLQLTGAIDNIEQMQKFQLRDQALGALRGMHLAPGNAELAALEGKPLEHVTIDEGNLIENRYSDAPAIAPTEKGYAEIEAIKALTGQRNAAANLTNVKAAAGGFAPSSGRGGGVQVTRTDTGNRATYTGSAAGGDKGVQQARAIIKDLIEGGGDPHGYSVGAVKRDMANDGEAGLIAQRAPGTLRFITGSDVRDLPLGGPPAGALPPQKAAVLAEAQQAIAAGKDPAAVAARLQALGHGDLAGML